MLLERGAGKVVITMGAKGSVIGTQENPIPQHIPVTPVEATDTTVCIYLVHLICADLGNIFPVWDPCGNSNLYHRYPNIFKHFDVVILLRQPR
jgi:hypothetical protein